MDTFKEKRKAIRYTPDTNTLVHLHAIGEPDVVSHLGVVYQEAAKGFGAIFVNKVPKNGSFCLAQVGNLPVLKAQVMWVEQLDSNTFKVGFEYLN